MANSSPEYTIDTSQRTLINEIRYADIRDIHLQDYCMVRSHPCQVKQIRWAKPGKHGARKVCVMGIGIFNGKKFYQIFHSKVQVPVVQHCDYELVHVSYSFDGMNQNHYNDIDNNNNNNIINKGIENNEEQEEEKKDLIEFWKQRAEYVSVLDGVMTREMELPRFNKELMDDIIRADFQVNHLNNGENNGNHNDHDDDSAYCITTIEALGKEAIIRIRKIH